jgi:hypothetical protein
MHTTIRALLAAALVVAAFGVAVAKLPPAPPLTEEQKAEKSAKDKAAADAEKARLAKAEDRVVARYMAEKGKGGAPNATPAPGGRPASGEGSKSLPAEPEKASNAHSPAKK